MFRIFTGHFGIQVCDHDFNAIRKNFAQNHKKNRLLIFGIKFLSSYGITSRIVILLVTGMVQRDTRFES